MKMCSYRCVLETEFVSPGTYCVAQVSLLVNSGSSSLSLLSAGIEAPQSEGWLVKTAFLRHRFLTQPPLCTDAVPAAGTVLHREGKSRRGSSSVSYRA